MSDPNNNRVILNGVSPGAKVGAKRSEESLTETWAEAVGGNTRPLLRAASAHFTFSDSSLRAAPPSPTRRSVQNDGWFFRCFAIRTLFLLAMVFTCTSFAAGPAPVPVRPNQPDEWLEQMIGTDGGERAWLARPDLRELWVPANRLKDILAKFPNAVVLSREQYEALVRDAALEKKPAPVAPRRAALTAAQYQARLAGKVVQVTAVLTVKVLADEWAQVPLDFGGASIGAVGVDGEAALMPEFVNVDSNSVLRSKKLLMEPAHVEPSYLLLRGRGERKVTVEFTLPVAPEAGLSRLRAKLPSAATGTFVFDLPAGQRVESPQPVSVKKTPEATSVTAVLSPSNPVLELSWRGVGDAAQALAPRARI